LVIHRGKSGKQWKIEAVLSIASQVIKSVQKEKKEDDERDPERKISHHKRSRQTSPCQ
jgi:hypothetical protein